MTVTNAVLKVTCAIKIVSIPLPAGQPKVFSSVRLGVSPKINALATIIIFLVSVGVFITGWLSLRWEKKRKLEAMLLTAES